MCYNVRDLETDPPAVPAPAPRLDEPGRITPRLHSVL
jgi:hypothetical protein